MRYLGNKCALSSLNDSLDTVFIDMETPTYFLSSGLLAVLHHFAVEKFFSFLVSLGLSVTQEPMWVNNNVLTYSL